MWEVGTGGIARNRKKGWNGCDEEELEKGGK